MLITLKIILFFLLLLIMKIKSIESKTYLRKYFLIRNNDDYDKNGLNRFSILDSNEKQYLYRLKISSDNNDEIQIISYPSKHIQGYLKGKLTNETLNLYFEILNLTTNQWLNGTIQKNFNLFIEKYFIRWNYQNFIMKKNFFSRHHKIYDDNKNLLAQFRMHFRWFNSSLIKYNLQIFSDNLPDMIYFFIIAIVDYRNII